MIGYELRRGVAGAEQHLAIVALVDGFITRPTVALPEFIAPSSTAARVWRAWRSWLGDDVEELANAAQLTAERDAAFAALGADVRRRAPIATFADLEAELRELERRDRGEHIARRGPRASRTHFGEWALFLVEAAKLSIPAITELIRTAPGAWTPAPFDKHDVPRLGLERRIEKAVARARTARNRSLENLSDDTSADSRDRFGMHADGSTVGAGGMVPNRPKRTGSETAPTALRRRRR